METQVLTTVIPGKAIIIVIDDQSYERMDKGDPFTLRLQDIGINQLGTMELVIGRASDEFINSITNPQELLLHIFRNYEERVEDGFTPYRIKFSKEELKNEQ